MFNDAAFEASQLLCRCRCRCRCHCRCRYRYRYRYRCIAECSLSSKIFVGWEDRIKTALKDKIENYRRDALVLEEERNIKLIKGILRAENEFVEKVRRDREEKEKMLVEEKRKELKMREEDMREKRVRKEEDSKKLENLEKAEADKLAAADKERLDKERATVLSRYDSMMEEAETRLRKAKWRANRGKSKEGLRSLLAEEGLKVKEKWEEVGNDLDELFLSPTKASPTKLNRSSPAIASPTVAATPGIFSTMSQEPAARQSTAVSKPPGGESTMEVTYRSTTRVIKEPGGGKTEEGQERRAVRTYAEEMKIDEATTQKR